MFRHMEAGKKSFNKIRVWQQQQQQQQQQQTIHKMKKDINFKKEFIP